ncbi:MAG: acyl-CoA dehydrogenase family protein [Chloroflexi bacterium]|nr:acyl-CoA dehydrogenase family protein [Chloroflexota bacterium]
MELTVEQKQIQATAREIARKELAPRAEALDREFGFPREGLRGLAGAGMMGMTLPAALGGAGLDTVSFVAAVEELARACASTALVYVTHAVACSGILVGGKGSAKGQYLPAMARGEKLGAFAATEAGCGANVFAATTSAKRQGEHYLVSGSKVFTTSAGEADVYVTAVRTSPAPGPAGLSLVVVDKGAAGLSFGRKDRRLGFNGTSSGEVFLDACAVPEANLLGQEGGYMMVAMPMVGLALIGAGAMAVGIAQAALDAAIAHAKSRTVGPQAIAAYQGVQFLISEMASQVEAARCLVVEAARARDRGPSPLPVLPFEAKLFATEMAARVTDRALQVHGGQGYTRDLPVERLFRDARGLTLHFSPSEMLKEMLGKMLLGLFP